MHLKITERAEWDIDHRAAFWEARSRGLGRDYLLHLQEELQRLSRLADAASHSRSFNGFHRFLTRRYSAQVFYEIEDDAVLIHGVFDCREDPEEIAEELDHR